MVIGVAFWGDKVGTHYDAFRAAWVTSFVLWIAITGFIFFRRVCFRCPRCGKYFEATRTPWFSAPRVPRTTCINCGLAKYSDT
jgi:hypothetical protein